MVQFPTEYNNELLLPGAYQAVRGLKKSKKKNTSQMLHTNTTVQKCHESHSTKLVPREKNIEVD